jgi:hypothetical protein
MDSFSIKVDLDDICFHPMLNGNKRHNISNEVTLKGKVTNHGMGELLALIFHDNICE